MNTIPRGVVLALSLGLAASTPSLAQQDDATRCADVAEYAALDFWVGEWEVYAEVEMDGKTARQLVGHNHIEKILAGCAVREVWTDTEGREGQSLFYIAPGGGWKQVWITEQAWRPGGTKEKGWVAMPGSKARSAVRFQGTIPLPEGGRYFDRTTLTAVNNGEVRQVIEVSRDGESWRTVFDVVNSEKINILSSDTR